MQMTPREYSPKNSRDICFSMAVASLPSSDNVEATHESRVGGNGDKDNTENEGQRLALQRASSALAGYAGVNLSVVARSV